MSPFNRKNQLKSLKEAPREPSTHLSKCRKSSRNNHLTLRRLQLKSTPLQIQMLSSSTGIPYSQCNQPNKPPSKTLRPQISIHLPLLRNHWLIKLKLVIANKNLKRWCKVRSRNWETLSNSRLNLRLISLCQDLWTSFQILIGMMTLFLIRRLCLNTIPSWTKLNNNQVDLK